MNKSPKQNLLRRVGQASRLSLLLVGWASLPPSLPRRTGVSSVCFAVLLTLLTMACSTTTPRVLEVASRTRLQDIGPDDKNQFFGEDQASRFKYEPQDLSVEAQREEFLVRWTPRTISQVKFEYRQVAKPAAIFDKTYATHGDSAKIFEIRGEEFRSGGTVSAWRVTLWNGDQLVAEKKSVLW